MSITTFSSRDFNHDTGQAKKAAKDGPVFITDRGKPSHVLLSIEEYQRITGSRMTLLDALTPSAGKHDFDFEPPRSRELPRPADLS